MFFVLGTTLLAMFQQVVFQWSWFGSDQNNLLFFFGAIIFVFAIWIALTAFKALSEERKNPIDSDKTGLG